MTIISSNENALKVLGEVMGNLEDGGSVSISLLTNIGFGIYLIEYYVFIRDLSVVERVVVKAIMIIKERLMLMSEC